MRIAFVLLLPVLAWLAGPLFSDGGNNARRPDWPARIPASQNLTEAFMETLCRRPQDLETVRWDSGTFEKSDVTEALVSTAEGGRVAQARRMYQDVLVRDIQPGDCGTLRRWVDGGAGDEVLRRTISFSPEARRAAGIRQAFVDTFGRDRFGWDIASMRRWVDSPLSLPEIRERLAAQRPLVGVHYFTWYRMMANGRWGNGATAVPSGAPRPSLGWYTSSDAAVMDTHIRQMLAAGFDFVVVDVVADDPASWANAEAFFNRLAGGPLKAALMLDGLGTVATATRASWVEKARREFAGRPNYLSVHGQPLIMLFSAPLDFAMPGVTLRSVYWTISYGPGTNTFNPQRLLHARDWPFWAETPQPVVNGLVPVVPGYSDTHLKRERAMEHPRDDGRMYAEQWRRALALRPELIIVYSWNEHFEQTAIEPTDAWGNRYLEWTACHSAHAHTGAAGVCP